MNWNSEKFFQAFRDAGYELVETSYEDTDEEGCDRYMVFVRPLFAEED